MLELGWQHMELMGWTDHELVAFVIANLITFLDYTAIGVVTWLRRETDHVLFSLFILACGVGHGAMAWHMLYTQVDLLLWSHVLTALISTITVVVIVVRGSTNG